MQSEQADRANHIEYRIKISAGMSRTIRKEAQGCESCTKERKKKMGRVSELQIREAIANFKFTGRLIERKIFGSGHINDTYLLTFEIGDMGDMKVILQRMNREIFTKPVELMENIVGVTSYLREKIIENGGNPERETLNIIPAKDGKAYFVDSKGEYWRSYKFITDATCYDRVEKPEDFYESAVAFGNFQRLLADYPAETLYEDRKSVV